MRTMAHRVSGEETTINVIETDEDLPAFVEWIKNNRTAAFDTESTGLNVYSNTFKIRLAQFGDGQTSWVIPVEKSASFTNYAARALEALHHVIIQNASFDLQVVARHWGVHVDWDKVTDTKILAHLVDARPKKEGGVGHSLEELTAAYIDEEVAADVKSSMKTMAKEQGVTKGEIWSAVDIDNPTYLRYAGMDPILTYRLYKTLWRIVPSSARKLVRYEHEVARICSQLETQGIAIDAAYTRKQVRRFKAAETRSVNKATELGVDNVNSREQVVEGLKHYGVTEFTKTATGLESADSNVLKKTMAGKGDAATLAKAVVEAKRAAKWRTVYFDHFLSSMDSKGLIHPGIKTLAARTARMSITNPAVQTLPGDSNVIRNCMLADEGHVWTTIDYDSQELRMAAALSQDRVMITELCKPKEEADLHQMTADAAGVDRKVGKMANFLTVYGGGWRALVTQAGVDEQTAKQVIDGIRSAYPGLARFTKARTERAQQQGYVETVTGRRLHVDPKRAYSAVNYLIQSASRDVTARALVKLDKAGFTPYMLLPVHDEIDFSFPAAEAQDMARQASKLMTMSIGPIEFSTDIQIGERAWGSIDDFRGKDFEFEGEDEWNTPS